MKVRFKHKDLDGKLVSAELVDERLRCFMWSRRCAVQQRIEMPVCNETCVADGYWRTAGRHDAAQVEKTLQAAGLLETRGERHARIAAEIFG